MPEKLIIELFKTKSFEDFSKAIASPDCRAQSGSAAAATAALSCSLFSRAANSVQSSESNAERVDYIKRNSEILRTYMVHLIDEDIRCRAPLRRAIKEGDERAIEAAYHTSCEINAEIINMMSISLELMLEACDYCTKADFHLIKQAAILSISAINVSITEILEICTHCTEDSFVFVSKRENEITGNLCLKNYNSIISKIEGLRYG